MVVGAILLLGISVLVPVLIALHRLHLRNRVSPGIRSRAPLTWIWAPSRAAGLHRRLRVAVAVVDGVGVVPASTSRLRRRRNRPHPGRLAELAADLEREAVALDEHLVRLRDLPRGTRHGALLAVAGDVRRLEDMALRLAHLHRQAAVPVRLAGEPTAISALAAELARQEESRAELDALERAVGLAGGDAPRQAVG